MELTTEQVQKNIKFILIDDDHINNFCAQAIIKRVFNNPDIKAFTDPELGLKHLKTGINSTENQTTILFLDINMPVLNGWDVLDAIEGFDEDIRKQLDVYMVSSSVDYKDQERAMSYPSVSGFISKPLCMDFYKHLSPAILEQKMKIA